MSVEKNKAAVERLNEEVFGKGNLAILPELFASHYVLHWKDNDYKGIEGFRQYYLATKKAFPDYWEKIDKMVGEGEMLATFYTVGGTYAGESDDKIKKGQKYSVSYMVLTRFENGKQCEAWTYGDNLV
jgi:predicted ester cyclase